MVAVAFEHPRIVLVVTVTWASWSSSSTVIGYRIRFRRTQNPPPVHAGTGCFTRGTTPIRPDLAIQTSEGVLNTWTVITVVNPAYPTARERFRPRLGGHFQYRAIRAASHRRGSLSTWFPTPTLLVVAVDSGR